VEQDGWVSSDGLMNDWSGVENWDGMMDWMNSVVNYWSSMDNPQQANNKNKSYDDVEEATKMEMGNW
jgi:hypothetical protein